ncbi:Apolipoprotein A1/A4/E domain protein [Caenorhabditis elegans]|uniref:Uncharacterized protein R10E11.5 n=2 Tax=Caenorhabditis elegans TaxID=6239 RepID=YNJ5_CAEEL|nr:Apolipoprotein A1/A4/E domain protein [Caenorhabditis elegans]P34549.3 RecName: Full=Uncharacterized protein R10E11.5 [Caenorhabditis elegans]CAA82348.3 Apolipoprotein A1/A4/E domain protein [Caenorhabditis elegans]|eukprot:NP_001255031.1 Uncharacterized protein CELE_R10E11.5 [Caenorhabditis elegans]
MASSAGRDKLRSRGQRVFAFGSSTPRDLSHMSKVPQNLRNYDAKSVDKSPSDAPSLHDYIVKARSLSREACDSRNQFVFGSSTPRTLAHLDKIPHKQRVYDAKIPKKNTTHSDFKAAPIRFNAPPVPITKPAKKEENRHVITSKDDDIASEPDIVQDREEFMNEMKKHKIELEKKKSLGKNDSKTTIEIPTPKAAETQQEHVKFAHAPEIAGNSQKAVRIQSETQEEAPVAVKNLSANKMNDQIEVSQLMNEITPESVPAVESLDNQKNANVVGDLLAKVQKVADDTIDKSKTTVAADVAKMSGALQKAEEEVVQTIDQTVKNIKSNVNEVKKDVEKNIAEKVDDITKELEKSAKSLEETTDKIGSKIDNTSQAIKSNLEEASLKTEKSVNDAVKSGEKLIGDLASEAKKTFDSAEQKLDAKFSKIGSTADSTLEDVKNGLRHF